jgi:DNA-binding CsgD family transcriptional regulator
MAKAAERIGEIDLDECRRQAARFSAKAMCQGYVEVYEALTGERPTVRTPDDSGFPGKEFGFSSRESQVLALIVQGRTNQEIAAECFLSINSVRTYIRSAFRKVGISHRARRWRGACSTASRHPLNRPVRRGAQSPGRGEASPRASGWPRPSVPGAGPGMQ